MASSVMGLTAIMGLAAATAYVAGTVVQVRSIARNVTVNFRHLLAFTVPALALHGITTFWVINTPDGLYLGFFAAASLVGWVIAGFTLIASIRLPVHNLLIVVLPIGALSVLTAIFLDSPFTPISDASPALVWHIVLSIAAYAVLFMAACQAVLLALVEHQLRSKHSFGLLHLLPPLETMESLLFTLLWSGITVLSFAIATGFIFLENMFAQHVVHHTILSMASWTGYAVLLIGHKVLGWRGTTAVLWALIAFTLLLLAYFGSKFVLEFLLD